MTEQNDTPKQVISEIVQDAPKTIEVQYGDEKYIVGKLKWGRFKTLLNRLREFIADILPEQMSEDELEGSTSIQGLNLPDLIRKFPIDFVEDLVKDTLQPPAYQTVPADTTVIFSDLDTELDFDTVLFLAGHAVLLNFIDNTGVRSFFTAFAAVIRPTKDEMQSEEKGKNQNKGKSKTRRH